MAASSSDLEKEAVAHDVSVNDVADANLESSPKQLIYETTSYTLQTTIGRSLGMARPTLQTRRIGPRIANGLLR